MTKPTAACRSSLSPRPSVLSPRRTRRGLGLVELVMSLTIVVGLLTAVATAFRAASNAIEYNDDYFRAAQAVRVAMARMTTQVRRADSCLATATTLTVITTNATTAAVTTDVFTYNAVAQTITVGHTVVGGTTTVATYTLPVKFTQAAFSSSSNANGTTVSIVLKATVGGMQLSLSGSGSPRKLLAY